MVGQGPYGPGYDAVRHRCVDGQLMVLREDRAGEVSDAGGQWERHGEGLGFVLLVLVDDAHGDLPARTFFLHVDVLMVRSGQTADATRPKIHTCCVDVGDPKKRRKKMVSEI